MFQNTAPDKEGKTQWDNAPYSFIIEADGAFGTSCKCSLQMLCLYLDNWIHLVDVTVPASSLLLPLPLSFYLRG
jgi:hypothetical protein